MEREPDPATAAVGVYGALPQSPKTLTCISTPALPRDHILAAVRQHPTLPEDPFQFWRDLDREPLSRFALADMDLSAPEIGPLQVEQVALSLPKPEREIHHQLNPQGRARVHRLELVLFDQPIAREEPWPLHVPQDVVIEDVPEAHRLGERRAEHGQLTYPLNPTLAAGGYLKEWTEVLRLELAGDAIAEPAFQVAKMADVVAGRTLAEGGQAFSLVSVENFRDRRCRVCLHDTRLFA